MSAFRPDSGYSTAQGVPLSVAEVMALSVGDSVYRRIGGVLVRLVISSRNPFAASTP